MSKVFLSVALPVPVPKLFDYLPPEGSRDKLCQPGMRIKVPFGKVSKIGIIIECKKETNFAEKRVKKADAFLDEEPLLTKDDINFLVWASNYYHFYIGEVVSLALPVRLRKNLKALPLKNKVYVLKKPYLESLSLVKNYPKQKELLYIFSDKIKKSISLNELTNNYKNFRSPLNSLIKKDIFGEKLINDKEEKVIGKLPEYELNLQQKEAIDSISQLFGNFSVFLLEGITGSGKTEIYLNLAKSVLESQQTVMILVPEISLTPQLSQRFSERLGNFVSVMHSGMSVMEREKSWQRVRLGINKVVVGTRSIIFSPVRNLGLIIVDEEHDSSFKQMEGFRYSARDLSVIRAQRAKCPVILGSATPSLESIHNVASGRYRHLKLTKRAGTAFLPKTNLIDIRDQPLKSGLSEIVIKKLKETIDNNQQAIIFLNRRGYASAMTCFHCNWISDCPRCDAYQTIHKSSNILWCHHCGSQNSIPEKCPNCGNKNLGAIGQGTEQVENFCTNNFPKVPLIRIDRDSTNRKGVLSDLLADVKDKRPAILVGTQMLAKGHHFPLVTLVVIMDVDGGLFSADFRATEKMAQLIIQVSGRSGRGEHPGQVLLQTRHPDHSLLRILIKKGYSSFAAEALQERKDANLPPYAYQALLRCEANKIDLPMMFLKNVADWIKFLPNSKVEVMGPIPAPMTKKVGRYRAQLLIQSSQRDELHPILNQLENFLSNTKDARKVRWSLDIDPVSMY